MFVQIHGAPNTLDPVSMPAQFRDLALGLGLKRECSDVFGIFLLQNDGPEKSQKQIRVPTNIKQQYKFPVPLRSTAVARYKQP